MVYYRIYYAIGETQSNPDSYAAYLYLLSIVFYT